MDTLPVELITNILSFLPLIDRIKCESINRKFNSICKHLWNQQSSIDENELPPTKWIRECQAIHLSSSDQIRSDILRWQLTLKCPRIKKIIIDDRKISSKFFIQRVPYIEHLTVQNCSENFAILSEAKSLQTIVFEESHCNEYEIIQHLTAKIISIEGPSICDPWVDRWDEIFEHSGSSRFENLVKLTVVISIQTTQQLDNLMKLEKLNHIRLLVGDDFENQFLIKYLQMRGSMLKGLELYQPSHYTTCENVYAAVSNNCIQLKQLGLKGYFHGQLDYNHFNHFLINFKSLTALSVNIPLALTPEEVDTVCNNNHNLRQLNYTYYMPSVSPVKLKNWKKHCEEMKLSVDNFNSRSPGRRNVIFDTSHVVKRIFSNSL